MSRNKPVVTNNDVFADLGMRVGPKKKQLSDDGDILEDARLLPIEQVQPNPEQPRKKSDPEKDAELVADIDKRGILQPIIVRPLPEGKPGQFQIVAGERRWRAAREAGLEEIPVIIKALDDQEAKMVSLVENLQRLDLDPEDETNFFRRLSNDYNLSNRQIARLINRSPGYVNLRLKGILEEPEEQKRAEPQSAPAPAVPVVRERPAAAFKGWRYRPQNFQRIRDYIHETIENWEQVEEDRHRDTLLQDITSLKKELEQLEQRLHGRKVR